MPAPTNLLKQRLQEGQALFGIWLGLADPSAVEIAATAGFDWLLIDGEHAPNVTAPPPRRGVTKALGAKHVRAGWPTYCGCDSVFSWFGGGTTWLEYPL
jgi:hypothetical protein